MLKDVSVSQLNVPTKMLINSTAQSISGFIEIGKSVNQTSVPLELFCESHKLYPLNACGGFATRLSLHTNQLLIVLVIAALYF